MSIRSRLKFWLPTLIIIFLVLYGWCFAVHESAHYAACAASGMQPSLIDYRTGNCAGLDTSPSWTFFFVKGAPYLLDVVAGLFLWLLVRRIGVVGLLAKGGTAKRGNAGPKKLAGSSGGNAPSTRYAEGSMKGIILFTALNTWAVAVLFDVASNYAGSLIGFTDFLSIIAYDKTLLVPAMAVTFLGLLFVGLFLREEWRGIRARLRRKKRARRAG